MARPPASEQVQVNFRMPADLKARIEAAAEANSRTTTAELVATLEEKYPAPNEAVEISHYWVEHISSAASDADRTKRIAAAKAAFRSRPDTADWIIVLITDKKSGMVTAGAGPAGLLPALKKFEKSSGLVEIREVGEFDDLL